MNTPQRQAQAKVDPALSNFVNNEVLPLTGLDKQQFWADFAELIDDFSPVNRALLATRETMQKQIDQWHQQHAFDLDSYKQFLKRIGYLQAVPANFSIETPPIDDEIATIAAPQLVVPLKNARFAINAANARWGSLYDALYGSDVIPKSNGAEQTSHYNPKRGRHVIEYSKNFLDDSFPLQQGSHKQVCAYLIYFNNLLATFADGSTTGLKDNRQFVASNGSKHDPESILLKNNGLHIELQINRKGQIGSDDMAGIDDIHLESALSTIMDCEDAVAAVDTADKVNIYRNWLGLIQGSLVAEFEKNGSVTLRHLNHDRHFTGRDGKPYAVPGRSLMMIRNVGLHMQTAMVKDSQDKHTPEGIIDAVITSLIGGLDLQQNAAIKNSRKACIYIVKPKLHGPHEVSFTCQLLNRVEDMLQLPRNTIKIGIMDEERRTSVNLKACIFAAKQRIAFINTGFLDRTGDEIHTSMHAGAFWPKAKIKEQAWFTAYEDNNVDVGLACGFQGRAQIGKGMWAMPDAMAQMLKEKIMHPIAGANTAWVPSPTAATLHALHYHKIDVFSAQNDIKQRQGINIDDMLRIPIMEHFHGLSIEELETELTNNIQSILGYVVHWVEQGIGCSKIPDLNAIPLMEDRATLRISSQHIGNWLLHGICHQQ
ncbi:MAG: malate synthase G, partial [Pseudomonadota bacterium]